jgi:hypothetical protein
MRQSQNNGYNPDNRFNPDNRINRDPRTVNRDPRADLTRTSVGRQSQVDNQPDQADNRHNQVDDQAARKRPPFLLYMGVGLVVILILIVAAATLSKPFRRQLEISIVRQPTPYTQLYFARPGTLPGKLKVDQKNIFDFTIVNDEGRKYSYTYTVTLADSRSHSVVTKDTVTIDNGGSVTRPATLVPKDRKAKYRVTVALGGLNQSIYFYGETS